jgi:hypothetical protein
LYSPYPKESREGGKDNDLGLSSAPLVLRPALQALTQPAGFPKDLPM